MKGLGPVQRREQEHDRNENRNDNRTIMGRRKKRKNLIRLKRGNDYLPISAHMEGQTKCPTKK